METVPSPPQAGWRTLPNLLSAARLVATPLLFWLIVDGHTNWATALMGAMGISDYLDGYIARRTQQVSDLGTVLDPVSDRVLVMAAIVAMLSADILPMWLGVPVLARDALLSIVFLVLSRQGFGKPKVRRVGKSATFALLTALPALLIGGVLRPVGLALFALGGILYFIAAYRYARDVRAFIEARRAPFAEP